MDKGGWASTDILRTRGGRGSIFRDFVRMSFMDGSKNAAVDANALAAEENLEKIVAR